MLLGRDAEREAIGRLVAAARLSTSGALVVIGEPGVGKTALLQDALDRLEGLRVLSATGLEAEREIPFSGLLQLLRPALPLLETLPPPQATALSAALALGEPVGGRDRFTIGAAVLTLLCRYAENGPIAVVVDDLHALDRPSAEAVVFAARRFVADPVAVLASARSPDGDALVDGLPTLRLVGLEPADAAALVEKVAGPVAPTRLAPLLRLAAGNPLALVELAADDLDALATDPETLPRRVPDAVTAAFGRRLGRLGEECRAALLLAAVCGGDLRVTAAACATLDVDTSTLAEAEDERLVAVHSDDVTFRHPLLRAAIYSLAGARQRHAAHRAVADVLPDEDAERRAWHLSEAMWHPDRAVSDLLARTAERAAARTAYSVASGAYERSAGLCPDLGLRAERLLDAADAAWLAGLTARSVLLLDQHAREHPGRSGRVRELGLRATLAAHGGSPGEAVALLVKAADHAAGADEKTVLLADAVHASIYQGDARLAASLADRLCAAADRVTDSRAHALGLMATGMARVLSGRGGTDLIRAAVPLLEATPRLSDDPRRLTWLMLAPLFLRDATSGRRLRQLVDELRGKAGVGALPAVLFHVARDQATTSAWSEALANYAEAVRLASETGQETERVMSLAGLCWLESRQGEQDMCRRHAREVLAACTERALRWAETWARFALGDLELSLGSAAAAVGQLGELVELLERNGIGDVDLSPLPELVDGMLRTGQLEQARAAATSYAVAAEAKGQPWARARAARALGMVADQTEFDRCFGDALELHGQTLDRFEIGRTRLAYGERLRRAVRRVDARVPLRAALNDFEALGAARWAERAAAELGATGELVRRRGTSPRSSLTPQELQVCLLLTDGHTTREAAAALFLSPKTVEYHLRKAYTKLGVSSRADLADLLGTGTATEFVEESASLPSPRTAIAEPADRRNLTARSKAMSGARYSTQN